MNELLLKQIAMLSAITGGALGILSLIPYVNIFSFSLLIICLSSAILVYMKKENLIGIFDLKEGGIFGGIIGFFSFLAFSIIFIPLDMLLSFIFRGYNSFLPFFFNSFGSFIVLVMLIFFLALLSALMNGFAGLTTAYVYELLSGIKKEENESVDFEIK